MKDGKPSVIMKEFWRDSTRFADVFNAYFFNGEEVIQPKDLQELDTDVSLVIKNGNHKQTLERTRDVVKKTAYGIDFILLGLESQMKVHYAMPLRHMIYDGLGYLKECEELVKKNKGKKHTSAEFLSKMKATDRLHPIFTLTIYYGEEAWNGPFTLKDMMVEIPIPLESQFSDYKMNLLQISKSGEYHFHHGEVEMAFGIARELLAGNLEQVALEYDEVPISYDVRAFIGAIVNVPEFMEEEQEDVKGMCRAIDEWRVKMREEGEARNIISLIRRKSQKGLNVEQICDHLEVEESYVEKAIELIEEHTDASDMEIVELMQEVILLQ